MPPDASKPSPVDPSAAPAEAVGDALRAAVERTLAATADSATGTRQRAQGLLGDVVRRSQVAREQVIRGGEEATTRLAEAIGDLRTVDDEGLRHLGGRLEAVERRLAVLEAHVSTTPKAKLEGESSPPAPLEQRTSGI